MRRLLLILLLSAGCDDSNPNGSCGKLDCCPSTADTGVSCGTVRAICGVDPIGSCVCGENFKWSCFGTEDLSFYIPDAKFDRD